MFSACGHWASWMQSNPGYVTPWWPDHWMSLNVLLKSGRPGLFGVSSGFFSVMATEATMDIEQGPIGTLCAYFDTVTWWSDLFHFNFFGPDLPNNGKSPIINSYLFVLGNRKPSRWLPTRIWVIISMNFAKIVMWCARWGSQLNSSQGWTSPPCQAIEELVMSTGPIQDDRAVRSMVPNESVDQFWLPLHAFDFGPDGKNGCQGF